MTAVDRPEPTSDAQIATALLDMAWRTERTPPSRPAPEAIAGARHRLDQAVAQLRSHRRSPVVIVPELVTRRDQARNPGVPFDQLVALLSENEHERVRLGLEQRIADLQALIETMECELGVRQPPAPPAAPEPAPSWLLRR